VVLIQAIEQRPPFTPIVEWLGSCVPSVGQLLEAGDPAKTFIVRRVSWSPIPAEKHVPENPEAIVTLVCERSFEWGR
jgi:hypothetical protein